MSTTTPPAASAPAAAPELRQPSGRFTLLTRRDLLVLGVLLGLPAFIHVSLVWGPTLSSVFLSFTRWDGIGGLSTIQPHGLQNYRDITGIYPPFYPALRNNILWLAVFLFVATPLGLYFAVLLDRELRFSRIYQSVLFLPVVLSLALVGFIWQLIYAPEQGLLNNILGRTGRGGDGPLISWLGNPDINIWAVLVAASWRHVGYIMILYLAGLKSVDPSLREAAAVDGANDRQAFFRVVFPVLKPINIIVLVVTMIEALRAFDIVYIINKGTNGLELLSVLITNNIVGEASRIGFGSALGVILLVSALGSILTFLFQVFRKEAVR